MFFFSLNIFFSNYKHFNNKNSLKTSFEVENTTQNIQTNSNKKDEDTKEEAKAEEWYLEIPSINLEADIHEGTTKEIMDKYIGHFEETSKNIGNVGLAAHNRGYEKNYFENLKNLKEGDSVFYNYKGQKREYVVTKHIIIKDTDWTNLEDTKDNTITLITCVENQPEYRRCIQGKAV